MKIFDLVLDLAISKRGVPCLWERGGGYTKTGNAQIIADSNGDPKYPLYVRTRGDLACNNHALIPVSVGDMVVIADYHHNGMQLDTYRIKAITPMRAFLVLEEGEYEDAEEAAVAKALHYHCRRPYYIAVPNPTPAPIAPPADDAEFDFGDDFGPDDDDELLV